MRYSRLCSLSIRLTVASILIILFFTIFFLPYATTLKLLQVKLEREDRENATVTAKLEGVMWEKYYSQDTPATASFQDKKDLVRFLLEKRADPKYLDDLERTQLFWKENETYPKVIAEILRGHPAIKKE